MLIVKDDFLKEPGKIRALALQSTFVDRGPRFPGLRSRESYRSPEAVSLEKTILDLFPETEIGGVEAPRFSSGAFQFLGRGRRKGYVHVDTNYRWAGIVFLSERRGQYPGTSFFRHRETGLHRCRPDSVFWRMENFRAAVDDDEIKRAMRKIHRDRFDLTRWERLMTVPARFNRLVLFDAAHFHMNASAWGTSPRDGRLTYNFFYSAPKKSRMLRAISRCPVLPG